MRRRRWLGLCWLVCLISASTHAFGQEHIEARIGNAEFVIPRPFVMHWLPNYRLGARLQVAFAYPQPEPLGSWRFDNDTTRWRQQLQSVRDRGGQVLLIDLWTRGDREARPRMGPEEGCKFAGGQIEKRREFGIDMTACVTRTATYTGGTSDVPGLNFFLPPYQGSDWRLTRFNSIDRLWTELHIPPDHLRDWRDLLLHADELLGGWRKTPR